MRLLLALLIAAPLAAQDLPIPVPDQILRVEAPPAEVTVNMIWPEELPVGMAQALADAYAEAAEPGIELLRQQIAQQQEQSSEGRTERIIKTAGWWALGIIALVKLHQIATREPDVTVINVTHEDGDINIDVPPSEPHDHHRKRDHDDDDSES